jgi:hypothetical protein
MLTKWDRLIPEQGINIYPNVTYRDANDISEDIRLKSSDDILSDPLQNRLQEQRKVIKSGTKFDRKYSIYVYQMNKLIGIWILREPLDNPHGYGKDDFHFVKYIYPEFRHTRFVRYASADLMHMLFISRKANRLYSYLPCISTESKFYMDKADPTLPCLGKRFGSDGVDVQKYIIVKEEILASSGNYIILEFNGDIYRSMDLGTYMRVHGRSDEVIDRWIKEMDGAACQIL